MTKYLGQSVAEKIGQLAGLPPEEREVVAYGLDYLLSGMLGLVLMLSIGLALGFFQESLIIIFCWTSMRIFAGGVHCRALWRCTVVNCLGLIVALLIVRVAFYLFPTAFWVGTAAVWSLGATWVWAPNNSERPVHDPKRRRLLRRRALVLVMVMSSFLFYLAIAAVEPWSYLAVSGATGLGAGGFMLSPLGFRLVGCLDQMLESFWSFSGKRG
ncbi:MAG: accessory gene regulator B family protein [Candidatus Contubernalis sp.]|nr:accessory gene regulator B family protein [Candidatus Contubernalis sp.]